MTGRTLVSNVKCLTKSASCTGRAARGVYVPDFAWRAGAMATAATGAAGDENVVDNFIPTVHRGDMFIEALRAKQVMSNLGVTFMGGLTNRIKMHSFQPVPLRHSLKSWALLRTSHRPTRRYASSRARWAHMLTSTALL